MLFSCTKSNETYFPKQVEVHDFLNGRNVLWENDVDKKLKF